MMMLRLFSKLAALLTLLLVFSAWPALAAEENSRAPALPVGPWIQGDPLYFDGSDGKELYALVFWATWCPACKASFAEISRWNAAYGNKGVGIVALTNEEQEDVRAFVADNQEAMGFRVALDREGELGNRFQVREIPRVVVLDTKGQVLLSSRMTSGLEKILAAVGTSGAAQAAIQEELDSVKRIERAEALIPIYGRLATFTSEKELLETVYAKIMGYCGQNPETLGFFVREILDLPEKARDPELLAIANHDALVAAEKANNLLDGKDPGGLRDLAAIKNKLGRRQEAINHLRAAITLKTDDESERYNLVQELGDYVEAENVQVRWHFERLHGQIAITLTLGGDTSVDMEATSVTITNGKGKPLALTWLPTPQKQTDSSGLEKSILEIKGTYAWLFGGSLDEGPFVVDITYRTCQGQGRICQLPQTLHRVVDLGGNRQDSGTAKALEYYRGAPVFLGPYAQPIPETAAEEIMASPALLDKEVALGANFSNHYRLVPLDCGEGCFETVLVNLYKGFVTSAEVAAKELAFFPDSEVLIQYGARPEEEPEAEARTRYTIWGVDEFYEMDGLGAN